MVKEAFTWRFFIEMDDLEPTWTFLVGPWI